MISKEKQKFIRSLWDKKTRIEEWLFLVEWEKSVLELINSDFKIKNLHITEKFKEKHSDSLKYIDYEISDSETIKKISISKSNNSWIAIVVSPKNESLEIENDEFIIVLDTINDPGNLWTIIRICDWYGIKKIIASKEKQMNGSVKILDFETAALLRDEIAELAKMLPEYGAKKPKKKPGLPKRKNDRFVPLDTAD